MTMPNEMPYKRAEDAFRAAQASCVREMGSFCEAHGGVDCKSCSKYKEGIRRREKRFASEVKETIFEDGLRDGKTIRLRKSKDYFHLEIGKFFDLPPRFTAERHIVITEAEMPVIKQMMGIIKL